MAFQKRDWIFILIIVVVVAGLAALSYFGPHPKPILPIDAHKAVTGQTTRAQCLQCHDPEKGQPPNARLTVRHPQKWRDEKFSCLGCHKIKTTPTTAQTQSQPKDIQAAHHSCSSTSFLTQQ